MSVTFESPDVERPPASSRADVTLVTRGVTVTADVRTSEGGDLAVAPDIDGTSAVSVQPGDQVELFWRTEAEERTLPARVTRVELTPQQVWYVVATGPAERSRRRRAVRAGLEIPVQLVCSGVPLMGDTVDLSEAGTRVVVDGWGIPPEPYTRSRVRLELADGEIDVPGEVVRVEFRAGRWIISLRFVDLTEKEEDRLRRRVFQALREERAAQLG